MDDSSAPKFHAIEHDDDWEAQGWSSETISLTPDPEIGAVLSIRVDPNGLRLIDRAAKTVGMTWVEFVEHAALEAAHNVNEGESGATGSGDRPRILNGSATQPTSTAKHRHQDEDQTSTTDQDRPPRRSRLG